MESEEQTSGAVDAEDLIVFGQFSLFLTVSCVQLGLCFFILTITITYIVLPSFFVSFFVVGLGIFSSMLVTICESNHVGSHGLSSRGPVKHWWAASPTPFIAQLWALEVSVDQGE